MDKEAKAKARERVAEIASEHYKRGDVMGWFEALYKESAGDNEMIPWADLEPNRYFRTFAEDTGLRGEGRTALVVGCGLGDDAMYLHDLGFKVTAFDISPTAIEWAKKLYGGNDINFVTADLFEPPPEWKYLQPDGPRSGCGFDLVLEIYTIQPLPIEMRPQVIDAIAALVGEQGILVVVTRGREDDEETGDLPWPLSRRDLSRFEVNRLTQKDFRTMPGEDDEPERFIVTYIRS